MTGSGSTIEIRGGADPYVAAAITAVINQVLDEEAAARARPPRPNVPSAWVRSASPQPFGRFVPPVLPDPGLNEPE